MKLRNLLLLGLASAALLAGCKKDELEDPGTPSISINPTTLPAFPVAGGADNAQTASLTSTRDWTATADAEWVVVSPASGSASAEPQEITIYADRQNDGVTRTATITFSTSTVSTKLEVSQTGAAGSIEDTYVYHNDFDKEAATQTYGTTGDRWPYLDQFEGWHNETGSGIDAVEYDFSAMSARNNTQSDGNYSDYEGSGVNNLMFGSSAHFQVNNIAVREGSLNYTLSFGTERYVYDAEDNTFNPEEFHVYVSDNGERWVELSYAFPDGFKNGRWDLASTTFTVPEGTTALYLYFSSDLGSAHRLDDLTLAVSTEAGTEIDFSQGGAIGGGDEPTPVPDDAVYFNDFDKEAATESYGTTGDRWPYLDQFDGWRNETGTGIAALEYDFASMSARNNSNSDASYSDYDGSGLNNLLFSSNAHFKVGNIALPDGVLNYTLSFGTEKYEYDASDNTFNPDEFHVYVSDNGERWVELAYTFPNGYKNGRWDLASSVFTVPSGTTVLYFYFSSDLGGAHRIDDLSLVPSETAGTSIDFSQGGPIGGGEEPGDEMTIAQVVVAADDTPVAVKGQVMAKSTNGFVISDETGNLFVYGGTNTPIVDQVEIGSNVTVTGTKGTYNNQAQIASPSVSDVTSGEAVYPDPVELNGNENAITSGLITYVTWTGVITKSGNYYNFDIAGANRTGSVYYADPSLNIDSVVGQQVVMTGYYVSHSSSFLYVLPVSVTASDEPYLNISDETKSVSSAAGSFTFDITSNTDWTVSSSDDTNFSVAPTSGSDNGTVTVTYTENTSSDSRAATITVRYGSESKALTVTQSGAPTGDTKYYVKVTSDLSDWSGQYLIVYEGGEDGNLAFDGSLSKLDATNDYKVVTVVSDQIESNVETDAIAFTIEPYNSGYSIRSASGLYIYQTSDSNGLRTSDSEAGENTISYTTEATIVSGGAYLRFNSTSNQMRFRYYKSSSYQNQKPIALYKLAE